MLLKFKTSNYKTFVDEIVFSMTPAPKQKDLEYSILKKTVFGKEYKAIPTSVIYGPNASGKTNVIGALETFLEIIKRGHIKNDDPNKASPYNFAMYVLELIPNIGLKEKKPVTFGIEFITENKHISYDLHLDLGRFGDMEYSRKILYEKLVVNGDLIFERKEKVEKLDPKYLNTPTSGFKEIFPLLNQNLGEDELFLSGGFKNIIDKQLVSEIMDWVEHKIDIVYRADRMIITRDHDEQQKMIVDKELSEVAHLFGACADSIGLFSQDKKRGSQLVTVLDIEKNPLMIPSESIESYGTVRFLNIFPLISNAIRHGKTLVIDEFDASIHPMVLLNIINIFHNDEINKKNAQLIFNTHNPIFLSSNVMRRDEIKFTEYEELKKSSTLYSLSDFGTSGENGVRTTDDYAKHYFISRYGAIKDIDFSDLFLDNK